MIFEATKGIQVLSNGSQGPLRLAGDGSVVVSGGYPSYYEMVGDGGAVYSAGTPVTGVAPQTSIGTTVAWWGANPVTSKVNFVPIFFDITFISGTLGAGSFVFVGDLTGAIAIPTVTAITSVANLLSPKTATVKAFSTATLGSAPTYLKPASSISAFTTSTATQPIMLGRIHLDGAFVIPPGTGFGITGVAAAGTSPLVIISCTWAEIPF